MSYWSHAERYVRFSSTVSSLKWKAYVSHHLCWMILRFVKMKCWGLGVKVRNISAFIQGLQDIFWVMMKGKPAGINCTSSVELVHQRGRQFMVASLSNSDSRKWAIKPSLLMYIRFILPIQINEQSFLLTHFIVHLFSLISSFAEICRGLVLITEEIKVKT